LQVGLKLSCPDVKLRVVCRPLGWGIEDCEDCADLKWLVLCWAPRYEGGAGRLWHPPDLAQQEWL
jgi:hypothetical protein